MERDGSNKIMAGIIVIVAVALIAVAASVMTKKEEQQTSQTDSSSSSQETESTLSEDSAMAFKDGTYTVSDTYPSPGGEEDIKVVLTVSNNVVTAVEVTQEANQEQSAVHQQNFQDAYKPRVIGKALSTLDLSRISGASLTTNAFNDALDQIRNQAKV